MKNFLFSHIFSSKLNTLISIKSLFFFWQKEVKVILKGNGKSTD